MVAICQGPALFREALANVVTSRGHQVVCCVSTLWDAVGAIERCPADVLLLDGSLTDLDALARLRRELGLRVLLLTDSGQDGSADAALDAGLADAILDDAVALVTLERAVNGQLTSPSRHRRAVQPAERTDEMLTARERDVIDLLAGWSLHRRHRLVPGSLAEHRQFPRAEHPAQARRPEPHRGGQHLPGRQDAAGGVGGRRGPGHRDRAGAPRLPAAVVRPAGADRRRKPHLRRGSRCGAGPGATVLDRRRRLLAQPREAAPEGLPLRPASVRSEPTTSGRGWSSCVPP